MKIFLIENKEWVIGLIASVSAFFSGRKSKKNSEKSQELENIKKVREAEKQLVDDMRERIDQLIKYNDYLENELDRIKKIVIKYKYDKVN